MMNREEKSILEAYKNGTLIEIATEQARRNENNFTYNWPVEKRMELLTKKAEALAAKEAPAEKNANQPSVSQPSVQRTFNTGCGFYGTKKDQSRGFDGIES